MSLPKVRLGPNALRLVISLCILANHQGPRFSIPDRNFN